MPKIEVSGDLMTQVITWQKQNRLRSQKAAVEALIENGLILAMAERKGFDTAPFLKSELDESAARFDAILTA